MSTPYQDRLVWRIAGDFCEHDSLGHTCQACADQVSDVLAAIETAGLRVVPVAGGEQGAKGGVPVERVEALVRLLSPEEMTPTAVRMIRSVCEEYE